MATASGSAPSTQSPEVAGVPADLVNQVLAMQIPAQANELNQDAVLK